MEIVTECAKSALPHSVLFSEDAALLPRIFFGTNVHKCVSIPFYLFFLEGDSYFWNQKTLLWLSCVHFGHQTSSTEYKQIP